MARRGSAGIGYGQAFLLVFSFLTASVFIFLFGMWVGRDLTERRLAEEPVLRMAVPVRPTPGGPPDEVGKEFYEGLKTKAYEQLQTPVVPTAEPSAEPTASPPELSTPTRAVPTRPVPTATRAVAPKPPTPPRAASPRAAPTAAGEARQGQLWTVQVGATMDSSEALETTLRLRAQGFAAYTVQAPLRGQTWYRIRVGRFANRDEARDVEAKLRQTGEFKGAYVTSQ